MKKETITALESLYVNQMKQTQDGQKNTLLSDFYRLGSEAHGD